MRILDLIYHVLVDIGNDDLPASRRVCDCLLCTFYLSFRLLVWLRLLLRLLLGLFVQFLVPGRLVLIQVLHELPDGRDRVVP